MDSLRAMPPGRAVWAVAWPMILVGWLRAAWLSVDAMWVGQLGPEPLTGLMATAFAWWIVDQLGELGGAGTQTRVAVAVGAGEPGVLRSHLTQGLWVGLAVGVAVSLATQGLAATYVSAIGLAAGSEAGAVAVAVLRTLGWWAPVLTAQTAVVAVLRGMGDTQAALGLAALGLVVNTAVDPALIHGALGVSGLGAPGASMAAGVAASTSLVAGLAVLGRRGVWPAWEAPSWPAVRAVVGIGGPVAVSSVGFSLVYVALGRVVTGIDPHAMAALGIGHRLEGYAYLFTVGMAVGTATVVGQHRGAGDLGRAQAAVAAADRGTTLALLAWTAVALVGAHAMVGLVTDAPDIREAGARYLATQVLVSVCMGWEVVYEGAFAGMGRTWPAMVVSIVGTIARVPLAIAVAPVFGTPGIWAVIAASTLAKGVTQRAVYRRMYGGASGGAATLGDGGVVG